MSNPTHNNLDVSFVTFRPLTDAEFDIVTATVTAALNEFEVVDFVDTITAGEA